MTPCNESNILQAIERCHAMILSEQLTDGGFLHDSWPEEQGKSMDAGHVSELNGARMTTFFTATILACLNEAIGAWQTTVPEYIKTEIIRRNAVDFLLANKKENWSFNYCANSSSEAVASPHPDDLDDTFVALAAMQGYDANLIDASGIAGIAKILTFAEVAPGGPYRTWLIAPDADKKWQDVDAAVNCAVGYFLASSGVALPSLQVFVEQKIYEGNAVSPYYAGILPVLYVAVRYLRKIPGWDARYIFNRYEAWDSWKENPLECAMAISLFTSAGLPEKIPMSAVASLIGYLLQEENVGMKTSAFCIDSPRNGKRHYAGARALTAAIAMEALVTFLFSGRLPRDAGRHVVVTKPEELSMLARVKILAGQRMMDVPGNLRRLAAEQIARIENLEIALVPYRMYEALGMPSDKISSRLLCSFALANMYGWASYAIYDDFLDGEGDPAFLPAASYFLRELTNMYNTCDDDVPGMRAEYNRVMNGVDGANAYEQLEGLVVLDDLADRSFGHALPALGVCYAAGYVPGSPVPCAIARFFKKYLIARQLHDDAHDWKEDMRHGRRTETVVRIMQAAGYESKRSVAMREIIANHAANLQKFFWYDVVPGIVGDIMENVRAARHTISTGIIPNPQPLLELLDPLELAAARTLQGRSDAIAFLGSYFTPPPEAFLTDTEYSSVVG